MARRIKGGLVGQPRVGALNVGSDAVISTKLDQDITIEPSGLANFLVENNLQLNDQSDLRFADSDSSNWVALTAPASITSDYTLTLPDNDGELDQVLATNGSGTLSWITAAVDLTDNTTDATEHYPTLTTATSDGIITALRRSSSKLTFLPSTGRLTTSSVKVDGLFQYLVLENSQTTNYTLALSDAGKAIRMNNTSTATVTVPPNSSVAFPIGTVVYVYRGNTGTVNLAGGAGVTVTRTGALDTNEEVYLRKRDTNVWTVGPKWQ